MFRVNSISMVLPKIKTIHAGSGMKHIGLSIIVCGLCFTTQVWAKPLLVEGNLDQWQSISFVNETSYQPIMDMEQGVVIRAESHNSASGYYLDKPINLSKTPILQWQWTAEQTPQAQQVNNAGLSASLQTFDETRSDGNDFVLRLVVSKKPMFGDKKSIHYVWSHSQPLESHWAFDENNKVLVVGGGAQKKMQWQTVFRHIQHDWQLLFNESIDRISSIMLMTDSDQIQGHSIGYYGDMQTLAIQKIADSQP